LLKVCSERLPKGAMGGKMACRPSCSRGLDVSCVRDAANCSPNFNHCSLPDREVLTEQELCLRMELSRQRAELLVKDSDTRRRREAVESQHLVLCEELHAALERQASNGFMGPTKLDTDKIQELVRKEARMRQEIMLSKEEHLKVQSYQKYELEDMEMAHDAVCSRLFHNESDTCRGAVGWCESPDVMVKKVQLESPEVYESSRQELESNYSRQASRLPESMSVMQEWTAAPVAEQAKAQQLKSDVGDVMRRVQANAERIKREREQFTSVSLQDTAAMVQSRLPVPQSSADKLPFAAAGMRIHLPDGRLQSV